MNENNFKPFDKVLVREDKESEWMCGIYSHYDSALKSHCAMGAYFKECIPYEGNKALLGTTDEPKHKRWRAENGDNYFCITAQGDAKEMRDYYDNCSNIRCKIGNYFRTKEEAEAKAQLIKQILIKYRNK